MLEDLGLECTNEAVAAVEILEEHSDSEVAEPETVRTWIGPGVARIESPAGGILLDAAGGRVAFFDSESRTWVVERLEDWQEHIDAEIATSLARFEAGMPRFHPARTQKPERIAGYSCDPFKLLVWAKTADHIGERIHQDLFTTRQVPMTAEIYATYRLLMRLFDRAYLDVPAERPPGVAMRVRTSRRPAGARLGELDDAQETIVRSIDARALPGDFFDIDALTGPAWPATAIEIR